MNLLNFFYPSLSIFSVSCRELAELLAEQSDSDPEDFISYSPKVTPIKGECQLMCSAWMSSCGICVRIPLLKSGHNVECGDQCINIDNLYILGSDYYYHSTEQIHLHVGYTFYINALL